MSHAGRSSVVSEIAVTVPQIQSRRRCGKPSISGRLLGEYRGRFLTQ